MRLPQLAFVSRRVWSSFRELFWTHVLTSGTMAMTLFIFGGFVLLQENLETLLKGWGDQIQIYAYLDRKISSDGVQSLLQRVRSLPEVEGVRHVTQEQAWGDFQAALGAQSGVLEGLPADVLPASFEIVVRAAHRDRASVEELAVRLRREKGIDAVEYPQEWVEKLGLVVLAVRWAKWILGGVLFIATLLIVGSTVRLAILARKDEIEIMQLVGAPEGLIKAPFILEGMVQGVIGGTVAIACLWLLFFILRDYLPASLGLLGPLSQFRFLEFRGMAMLLVVGWLMGASGALFSLRRFLRTWGA